MHTDRSLERAYKLHEFIAAVALVGLTIALTWMFVLTGTGHKWLN